MQSAMRLVAIGRFSVVGSTRPERLLEGNLSHSGDKSLSSLPGHLSAEHPGVVQPLNGSGGLLGIDGLDDEEGCFALVLSPHSVQGGAGNSARIAGEMGGEQFCQTIVATPAPGSGSVLVTTA